MALTYDPVATITVSAPVSSVTFSAIPATWTDLVLVCFTQTSLATNTFIRFNGDTVGPYSYNVVTGNGTVAAGAQFGTLTASQIDHNAKPPTSGGFGSVVVHINGYLNGIQKQFASRADSAGNGVDNICGMWQTANAITSITLKTATTETFSTGSVFSLYGILAA